MANKQFSLNSGQLFTVYKRRGARHLRLTITPKGEVRVSIPAWSPYKSGVEFARSREAWINAQRRPHPLLEPDQRIGKSHHLEFVMQDIPQLRSYVRTTTVSVHHPPGLQWHHESVQLQAEKASIRALRKQAETLLPNRLETLAKQHDFTYTSVRIKQMKSRWGSCDSEQRIVLNLFLMQLPWECIDYVLLHELMHTRILRHGPDFWAAMMGVLPDLKERRKQIRAFQPLVQNSTSMP